MVKFVKKATSEPCYTDILMAMGKVAPNALFLRAWPKSTKYPATTFTAIAKAINTTAKRVKEAMRKANEPDPAKRAEYFQPPGRKPKVYDFNNQQLEQLMSAENLCRTKHLSLRQKCMTFATATGTDTLKEWDLLKYYKSFRVTRQKLAHRLGPPNLATRQKQMERIAELQNQMRWASH